MFAPAVDYEGSGAVHYIRAETFVRREIQLVWSDWTPYQYANSFALGEKIEFTVLIENSESSFEARKNLQELSSAIARAEQLSGTDLAAAENALQRLRNRRDETVERWAAQLSADLASHRD